MRNLKSQVTIFIILGIVMAIIFGFIFYISQKLTGETTDDKAQKIYDDFLRATAIEGYVQDCLEGTTKEAISLAALQGGMIYEAQIGKDTKDPSLVTYLSFNKDEDTTKNHALDNDGNLNDVKWTIQGRFDAAYEFDGKTDYIDLANHQSLNFNAEDDFTIMAWIKTNSSDEQPILSKGSGYNLKIINGFPSFSISGGATVSSDTSVTDGLWHHIAGSLERLDSQDHLTLFIDGLVVDEIDISIGAITNEDLLLIGKHNLNFFNGIIDEVIIYKRAIPSLELISVAFNKRTISDPITPNDIVPYQFYNQYYNVSYSMKAPIANINKFNLEVPLYPYEDSLVENPSKKFDNDRYLNLLSYNNNFYPTLLRLCDQYGPNYYKYIGARRSCETYSPSNNSIQRQLREYIINKTKKCINFSYFSERYDYNVTSSELTGDILLGEDHVSVSMKYPFIITVKGNPPVTRFLNFNFRLDSRFKKLHELAKHIIRADTNNIFFNITDDPWDCKKTGHQASFPCKPGGVTIKKELNYCFNNPSLRCDKLNEHYKYSHILRISDEEYKVAGKALTFLLLFENRIPVLDYIDETLDKTSNYYNYLNESYTDIDNDGFKDRDVERIYNKTIQPEEPDNYNIVVDAGEEIEIFPFGIDPDDESVKYTYSGWKTPIMIFNISGNNLIPYIDPNLPEPQFGERVSGGATVTQNYWENSYYYQNGFNDTLPKYKDANYTTDLSDVGYHFVRINVTDNKGLHDYQDIKIQVR